MDALTLAAMAAIFIAGFALGYARRVHFRCAKARSASLAVPELTRGVDIQVNERVWLRRCAVTISFADDAAPLYRYLDGRLDRGGGGLALVPVRLCPSNFRRLNSGTSKLLAITWPCHPVGFFFRKVQGRREALDAEYDVPRPIWARREFPAIRVTLSMSRSRHSSPGAACIKILSL